jgi:hypothetical protein
MMAMVMAIVVVMVVMMMLMMTTKPMTVNESTGCVTTPALHYILPVYHDCS